MSNVNDTGIEAFIIKADTLEQGIKIRHHLMDNSSHCWFFLYSQSNELYVSNEYGGRINAEILETLRTLAKEFVAGQTPTGEASA